MKNTERVVPEAQDGANGAVRRLRLSDGLGWWGFELRKVRVLGRPTVWKLLLLLLLLLLIVAYLAFYLVVGQTISLVFSDQIDSDNIVEDTSSIIFGLALPIAIGAIALLVFTAKVGWNRVGS